MASKKRKPDRIGASAGLAVAPKSDGEPVVLVKPNRALKQVREATGMTQAEFAETLAVSAPYIQAVELGQRKGSAELAKSVQYKTGAWYQSIFESWEEAVDGAGEPYTTESYQKFYSAPEETVTDAQIEAFVEPLASLARAAAKKGKLTVLGSLLRGKLTDVMRQLDLQDALTEVLRKNHTPVAKRITVGELRSNSTIAALLGYKDDARRSDGEIIVIEGAFQEHPTTSTTWFPQIKWYPRADEIKRKYEERCAKATEPVRADKSGKR